MLNDIEEYCNTWGLKINVNKTKVLIFEKSKESTHYDFYLYNKKLEVVSSFKYLGVYFFKNGHVRFGSATRTQNFEREVFFFYFRISHCFCW